MKFAFIDAEKALYPILRMCCLLAVSRAGFYAWVGRPPSAHAVEDQRLAVLVREAHERSRQRYGAPRVQEALAATHDAHVSRTSAAATNGSTCGGQGDPFTVAGDGATGSVQ